MVYIGVGMNSHQISSARKWALVYVCRQFNKHNTFFIHGNCRHSKIEPHPNFIPWKRSKLVFGEQYLVSCPLDDNKNPWCKRSGSRREKPVKVVEGRDYLVWTKQSVCLISELQQFNIECNKRTPHHCIVEAGRRWGAWWVPVSDVGKFYSGFQAKLFQKSIIAKIKCKHFGLWHCVQQCITSISRAKTTVSMDISRQGCLLGGWMKGEENLEFSKAPISGSANSGWLTAYVKGVDKMHRKLKL